MALTMPNQYFGSGNVSDTQILSTPTTGNWHIAFVYWTAVDPSANTAMMADWSRNMWTLLYTTTTQAFVKHPTKMVYCTIWACPSVLYTGQPNLGTYGAVQQYASSDCVSMGMSLFEIQGMINGYLTVDSVVLNTATAATSFSVTLPTPAGGANCLMVTAAVNDNNALPTQVAAGWTGITSANGSNPNYGSIGGWRESTTGQVNSWTTTAAANWVGIGASIRVTGTGPTQTNPNWPVVDFQLGLGYNLSTPTPAITWTSIPNRLTEFNHERGIQFELGSVQSSPTDLKLRNDDGALSPRPAGSGTATSNGSTSTFICSSTDSATMTVTDYFQLKTSGGALKEFTVFQVTGITTVGGTSTVSFIQADGAGVALVSTATGDKYVGTAIDIYTPYRIIATWQGKQYPVSVGWIERWPQVWDNPHWGNSTAIGIDPIATLSANDYSVLQGEILRRNPQSYWPLGDSSGVSVAQNISGVGTTVLTQTTSGAGGGSGTATFGGATRSSGPGSGMFSSVFGDPGSGWAITGMVVADMATKGFALVANDTTFPPIANGVTIYGTMFCPDNNIAVGTVSPTIVVLSNTVGAGFHGRTIKLSVNPSSFPVITVWDQTTGASTSTTGSTNQVAIIGYWTSWALTLTRTSVTAYVQGALGTSATCNLVPNFDRIDIGGEADPIASGHSTNWTYAHVAVFPRVLTAGEISDIDSCTRQGWVTGASAQDQVIERKLNTINWKGPRVCTYSSTSPALELTASTIAEHIVNVADYNAEKLWSDAAGQIQYRARSFVALQTVRAVLGDRPDLGEIPYVGDSGSLQIDYDPTYIYNRISVTNRGIITAYNWQYTDTVVASNNAASIAKYGQRTLGKTVSFSSDTYTTAVMNYYLAQYAFPRKRVSTVTLEPAKDQSGSTFTFCLGVEVGDFVTFKRRPIGAPPIVIPCVVLDIKHSVAPDVWETTLTLAPAPV